ncbi:MAG TPA: TylF/MycF/NovP-related O-methyltransferase [Candidatus Paceibacterota bacterium]|nr:TylF/MycF/NovP-related O-methyltransferase [Candidatus Paceibacterota bacterium]
MSVRSYLKRQWPLLYIYRKIYYAPKDVPAAFGFIFHSTKSPTAFSARLSLVLQFYKISYYVDCPHTEHEMISIARQILALGDDVKGTIVEAGSFHGGSTAKLGLVAKLCDRQLDVFDSFAGMPENSEAHGKSIYGREHHFPKGSHAVPFEEVKGNVARYGDASRAHFHKGFFTDTMPSFRESVAAACVNVDLVQSTRDCFHYLYPLLSPGGIIISQDAHFPWIIELLKSDAFWRDELGVEKPAMPGLGTLKFVTVRK